MFTKSNNQKLSQLPNFILLMTKNVWNKTYKHQLLRSSKLHFDLNFGDLEKWSIVYVELNKLLKVELQQTLIWKFLYFIFNSLQVHQCTQYWEVTKIFCLCNLSSNILSIFHQNQVPFYIESTSKCMMLLCKLLVLLQLYSNFHTKWQRVLISIVSNSTSHKLDPYQMQPIANP
jgi:hypothetical protein